MRSLEVCAIIVYWLHTTIPFFSPCRIKNLIGQAIYLPEAQAGGGLMRFVHGRFHTKIGKFNKQETKIFNPGTDFIYISNHCRVLIPICNPGQSLIIQKPEKPKFYASHIGFSNSKQKYKNGTCIDFDRLMFSRVTNIGNKEKRKSLYST